MSPPLAVSVLAATGVLSAATVWQALDPGAALAPTYGTAMFLAILGAAAIERPAPPLVVLAAGAIPLGGCGLAVGVTPMSLTGFAIIAFAFAVASPAARPFVAAVAVVGAPAALLAVAGRGSAPLAIVAIGAALGLAVRADARRGALAVAIAAVTAAVAFRHTVVASSALAPDDVAAPLAALALAVIAIGRPSRVRDTLALGFVLTVYVLVGAAIISGSGYGNDAVAVAHRAAEHLLAWTDPYRQLDSVEALARFGLPPGLATHLEDGALQRSLNYPSLVFLLPAPFIALGLADVRVLYLGLLVVLALLLVARLPADLRPLGPAALAANDAVTRQHLAAGVDPAWAVLMAGALALVRHRWLSAILLGLAGAARQQAWLLTPFYLWAVGARFGPAEAGRRAAIAAAAFALPNAPFVLADPGAWLAGVTAPLLLPLEPHGVGLVRLGMEGLGPLLPRAAYGALAVGSAAVLLFLLRRRDPDAFTAVAPLGALWLAWRSLLSSFALGGALALAGEGATRRDVPLSPREEVTGADRS